MHPVRRLTESSRWKVGWFAYALKEWQENMFVSSEPSTLPDFLFTEGGLTMKQLLLGAMKGNREGDQHIYERLKPAELDQHIGWW